MAETTSTTVGSDAERPGRLTASAVAPDPARADADVSAAVSRGADQVVAALTAAGSGGRQDWVEVAARCQSLVNTLTAVQDAAIVQVARREGVWAEDGTLDEVAHAPGRVTIDAADLVAPAIGASHAQAQRRVEQAVRLAANRVPLEADDRDLPEHSGLAGLHHAMTTGHLDGYRAGVIAHELDHAPAPVADAVVAALTAHLHDDAPTLRRRTRRLLARICPDLLRQRAQRARSATGLRRWVAEPGVDEWHGTFPSEDAATAWAAIDHLAHDLVAAGTCTTIEQARGKALTDLVTGNATIDVQVLLTVPADTRVDGGEPPNTAGTARSSGVGNGERGSAAPTTLADDADGDARPVATHKRAAAADDMDSDTQSVTTPSLATVGAATDRSQPAGACPTSAPATVATPLAGGREDDLVQVQGARPSEPLLVRRGWLNGHLGKPPASLQDRHRGHRRAGPLVTPCDPATGARLDPHDDLATDAYRPSAALTALVKARDGRCRFPGCSVAARFCDLDHVRPWPTGPTTATNLLTLCRRHHRIKQRPGWSVRLHSDGTTTWTDPSGRVRDTAPLDALQAVVLRSDAVPDEPARPAAPEAGAPATAWSTLETHLEVRLEHRPLAGREPEPRRRPTHRRCTSAAVLRAGFARRRARAGVPDAPPF